MSYSPGADVFRPGLQGNNGQIANLMANVDQIYADYGPPIFGPVACSLLVMATTDVKVAEIDLPANVDNVPIYCRIRWRGTTGVTATVTFEIDDGGTVDTDTDTNTSSSYSTSTLLITPTSENNPRVARLYLRAGLAGAAQIVNVVFGYAPAAPAAGVLPSSVARLEEAWADDNAEIPTEVIERSHNNIRAVAIDRPAGLAGGLNRYDGGGTPAPGPVYNLPKAGSTLPTSTWQQVERWLQPGSDVGLRFYRLSLLLEGDGVEARMVVGPHTWSVAGDGWHSTVVAIALSEGMRCAIYLRSSTAADVAMSTWQAQRAAPPVEYPPVAFLYRSPGAVGDYAEASTDEVAARLFPGTGLGVLAVSLWVRAAVGADVSVAFVLDISDDGSPGFYIHYDGSTNIIAGLTNDANLGSEDLQNEATDGTWHHIFATSRCAAPDFDTNGVQLWYDGVPFADGASRAGAFATAVSLLRLFARRDGSYRLAGDIANVAFFTALPQDIEIPALTAAGVTHDPRNASGRWRPRKPRVHWRESDLNTGLVPDSGTSGTCTLGFAGNLSTQAL